MHDKLARNSFLLSLLGVTLLFGAILLPFSGAILWAVVVAIVLHPLQARWTRRFAEHKNLLTLTVLSICTVIIILPLLGLIVVLAQEGAAIYDQIQSGEINPIGYLQRNAELPPQLQQLLDRFGINIAPLSQLVKNTATQGGHYLASQALNFGQNTAQFFVAFALMLYLAFFFLRDGSALVRLLIRALPLGDSLERRLLDKVSQVVIAIIRGNFTVAFVQGALGGLIFWILDVPAPLLGGAAMMLTSLLPTVGAALIWAPVAIYFLATGAVWQGVVLIVFGAGVIGLIDNFLRPMLVGRDTKMPDYLILVSTLGGISLFGLNGFVVGPLIAALFISFWDIFIREFNPS